VHEAAQDPPLAAFVRRYMDEEGTPTLQPVPGIDLDGYKDTLLGRFANPYVRDQVQRLCLEASDRIPKFVLPVVREQLAHDRPVSQSAAIVASWAGTAKASTNTANQSKSLTTSPMTYGGGPPTWLMSHWSSWTTERSSLLRPLSRHEDLRAPTCAATGRTSDHLRG
jgi:hypothetical protein